MDGALVYFQKSKQAYGAPTKAAPDPLDCARNFFFSRLPVRARFCIDSLQTGPRNEQNEAGEGVEGGG